MLFLIHLTRSFWIWKYQNWWPYRLINFTSLLSIVAVCARCDMHRYCKFERHVYRTVSTVHYRSIWGEVARTRRGGIADFFEARNYFRKAWLPSTSGDRHTVIIFLPSNYRAPSCQCARLFHELTKYTHLTNGALIFARRSRGRQNVASRRVAPARSQFSITLTLSPCVPTRIRVRHLRPTNSKFTNRIINSGS